MSLKDTLAGARREVQDAGGMLRGRDGQEDESTEAAKTGAARRGSAARARPARDAAASVRVVSASEAKSAGKGKKASEMTREERKAEREERRSREDRRITAANVIMERDGVYRRRRRTWWVMLGVGFGLTIASFVLTRLFPLQEGGGNAVANIAAIAVLVAAYVLIIVSFIYDWRKIRPLRKAAEERANGMTERQTRRLLDEDAAERAAKAAEKKARKGRS